MAGSNAGFNASDFRTQIKFAMQMGAPAVEGEQAVFHFPAVLTYNTLADGDQLPFNPETTVTSQEPTTVKVDCAIDYFDAEDQPTNFGLLAPTRIAVTLLDEDYVKVKECTYVVVHGDRYDFRRTEPPSGLFEVGVYTMHFTSRNET